MRDLRTLGLLFATLLACGDDSAQTGGAGGGGSDGGGGAGDGAGGGPSTGGSGGGGGSVTGDFTAGGDRPVLVELPSSYDPASPAPLLILLHGYTATGAIQEAYFQLGPEADSHGMVFAHPDGTVDTTGENFWNATDACCDFGGTAVDDSAYLAGLVSEIQGKVNIDPKRIYFVGHSNGGFMSYRMACDHADTIAAIVSLAGATFLDPADCAASEPVSVLQIHGTLDETVAYDGGTFVVSYPSAQDTVAYWAGVAGCAATPVDVGDPLDLDAAVDGAETVMSDFQDCTPGVGVSLWTLEGSSHVPDVTPGFRQGVVAWLMAHPKP